MEEDEDEEEIKLEIITHKKDEKIENEIKERNDIIHHKEDEVINEYNSYMYWKLDMMSISVIDDDDDDDGI